MGKKKKVKQRVNPSNKQPRIPADPQKWKSGTPSWCFKYIRSGQPYCFLDGNINTLLKKVLPRLQNYETMTWNKIMQSGKSHYIDPNELDCNEAKKYFFNNITDYEEKLFSLRIDSKKRVWGILERGTLYILWWDPQHQIYKSEKKHT